MTVQRRVKARRPLYSASGLIVGMSLGAGCGRRRPENHFLPLYSGVFSHAREIVRLIAQRFLPWSTPACALPGVLRRAATAKSTVLGMICRMVIGRGEQERSEGHTLAADNSYPTRLSPNALRRLYLNRALIPAVCPFSSCAFPTQMSNDQSDAVLSLSNGARLPS